MAKPLSVNTIDNERNKFQQDSAGDTAVNIVGQQLDDIIDAINGNVSGSDPTINVFSEVLLVPNAVETPVVSYVVPSGTLKLNLIEYSGQNIALYTVKVNGTAVAKRRTYFSGGLAGQFEFNYYELIAGDVVTLTVIHARSDVGDFEGRIMGVQS